MFNIKKAQITEHKSFTTENVFFQELKSQNIYIYDKKIKIGDEIISSSSIEEFVDLINDAIKELKIYLWESWKDIGHLSQIISENNAGNNGGINNIIFLNSVKNSFLLSKNFNDLEEISRDIEKIFHIDAAEVHEELISKFNKKYIEIRVLHYLIMNEIYRCKLIKHYLKNNKVASVSGPFSNLDLPMKERVWEWSEDEEYFEGRTKARRQQTRYNPEYNSHGFYYVWNDLSRGPYSFGSKDDSPYKSRHLLTMS